MPDVSLTGRLGIAIGHPRQPEIQDLRLAVLVDQDIAGFQIAVDDAALMGVLNGFTDLNHQGQPLARVQVPCIGIFAQGLAVDDLHGEERLEPEPGIGRAGLIDLGDARMLEAAERLGFLLEAAKKFRAGPGGLDDLQRDSAPRLILLGLIHGPHPAFTQKADDPVTPDAWREFPLIVFSRVCRYAARECCVRIERLLWRTPHTRIIRHRLFSARTLDSRSSIAHCRAPAVQEAIANIWAPVKSRTGMK